MLRMVPLPRFDGEDPKSPIPLAWRLPRFARVDPTLPLLILPRSRGRWREAPEGAAIVGAANGGAANVGAANENIIVITATSP